jgi:alkylhydroperoxidase/carboxymuconolactone decarboxylase family protein YurZ
LNGRGGFGSVGRVTEAEPVDERRRRLRERYETAVGSWDPSLDPLLELDPDFFAAYAGFVSAPWRDGGHLEPKVKELVLLAVDAAATHLHEPGIRLHVRRALEHGATEAELLEVLQLTATMGIHSITVGVPVLLDAAGGSGRAADEPLTERQAEIKRAFEEKRGYWNAFWDGVLDLDPEFFASYVEFSGHPWDHGVLEPKVKELIYTAFDASATHMYVPGLRQHIENALGHGATRGEVMEVLELASSLGIHTHAVTLPILADELRRARGEA